MNMIARFVAVGVLAVLAAGCGGRAIARVDENPAQGVDLQLRLILHDLSQFARDVDAGRTTLVDSRRLQCQPDRLLTELRDRVHRFPECAPLLLAYLRSADEPWGARALAVMAIAQPDRNEGVSVLGRFLADPPDMKLVLVWATVFEAYHDSDWDSSLYCLRFIVEDPAWWIPDHSGWGMGDPGRGIRNELNFHPLVEGLITLLQREDVGRGRSLTVMHASHMIRDGKVTEQQRHSIGEIIRQSRR